MPFFLPNYCHLSIPVSGMSHSFNVPVSAKIRLCQPVTKTVDLALRLEAFGASWVTLHARTVSARRRRQGAADLSEVKTLKQALRVPVISNGNVRVCSDIQENLAYTGADGIMVGETLLGNPWCVLNPFHSSGYLPLLQHFRRHTTGPRRHLIRILAFVSSVP